MEINLLHANDILEYKKDFIKLFLTLNINDTNIIEDLYYYLKEENCICIGAKEENKIIGFLWAYRRKFAGEERYHINYFSILSTYQNQNIGTILLKKLKEIANTEKIKIIDLNVDVENLLAQKFYKKNSFKEEKILLSLKIGDERC